jgi:hypothetical protein
MPDEPQELASVEDNTRPAFGVLGFTEGEKFEDLFVELGTAVEPGNTGDTTKGGLKGGQPSIQSAK